MKRLIMLLAVILLSTAFASADPDWDWWNDEGHHHHHDHHNLPEPSVVPMLALSITAISGGLISRRRRS